MGFVMRTKLNELLSERNAVQERFILENQVYNEIDVNSVEFNNKRKKANQIIENLDKEIIELAGKLNMKLFHTLTVKVVEEKIDKNLH